MTILPREPDSELLALAVLSWGFPHKPVRVDSANAVFLFLKKGLFKVPSD